MKKKNTLFSILISSLVIISNQSIAQRMAAGGRHSLTICSDSTVEAWGYNGYGQLGNGNIVEQHSGTQIIGLKSVVQVAGGLFHSLFVKSDGTVWSCGRNPLGPLGDGTNSNKTIPVQVLGLTDIIQAAGGGEHSLFLKSDGTVWACGNNSSGQLGDGTNTNKNTPVQVINLIDIVQVAAGAEFSLFLKSDGTVWACGHNGYGQFGSGTNSSSKVPVLISGLSDIIQITGGEWHSLFVKNDGSVFSSGRNQFGQLGDGTTRDKNKAELIPTLTGIIQAEAGGIHSVFLKNDGSVWSCGLNSGGNNDGQLGDGTAVDRPIPVQVISSWGGGKIVRAEATREHSLFLKSDGELWATGRNNYGQLGYGAFTTLNSSTPVLSKTVCNTLQTTIKETRLSKNEIKLFPNPGHGVIYLEATKDISHIEIVDKIGKKVYSHANIHLNKFIELSLVHLPSGIYFLKMMDSNLNLSTKKLMIF
ncbi:MAG: T9SS type A sorting domain-containing protein [Saprospiraceae bacterium]|nr:T9SS type A sorting domain-containing protein [Saprospiraceae bacterium]